MALSDFAGQMSLALLPALVHTAPTSHKLALHPIHSTHHIAGRTVTGEFTALMGPSGAGKTTLMDCIALRQRAFEGAIHVDGRSPKSDYFTQTGYVHQKELFFSSLTSREHLMFHSINRLGGKYTKDQCLKRVDEVINEVELMRCADTIIGGGEFALVKGLSGGERKRLAIGTELLSHPKIIFLDEPTSGMYVTREGRGEGGRK